MIGLSSLLAKFIADQPSGPLLKATGRYGRRTATPSRGGHDGSNNHNRGESKTRRRMAATSNKINRRRRRRWKH